MESEESALTRFDASPEGWQSFQRATAFFDYEHGLVVLRCGDRPAEHFVSSWHFATRYGLADESGVRRFEKSIVLIGPGAQADQARDRILGNLRAEMERVGTDALFVRLAHLFCEFRALVSLDSRGLIEVLENLPKDSACCILGIELFRFADLTPPAENENRATTDVEIAEQHLNRLLVDVYEVAKCRHLSVLAICCHSQIVNVDIEQIEGDNVYLVETSKREQPQSSDDMVRMSKAFRQGGWAGVDELMPGPQVDKIDIAAALFEHFAGKGELLLAWQAFKPHIDALNRYSAGTRIAIAKAAHVAGEIDIAAELLEEAIREGLRTLEETYMAHALAEEIRLDDVSDQLVEKLQHEHPGNALTLKAVYHQLFRRRDFAGALSIAEQLGTPLQAAQSRAFGSSKLEIKQFLAEAKKAGDLEEALLSSAQEALYRGKLAHAVIWARQIGEVHPLFQPACVLRFNVLRTAFRKAERSFFREELVALMRIVATRPDEDTLRGQLDQLLEVSIEEPLAHKLLAAILFSLVYQQTQLDDQSIQESRKLQQTFDFSAGAQKEDEFVAFAEAFGETLPGGYLAVGQGELPGSVRNLAGSRLIKVIADGLTGPEVRRDLDGMMVLLHALSLLCNAVGDPNTDFLVLNVLIEFHGSMGRPQDARNLGETALRFWSHSQITHTSWRTAQAWACFAEAFLRSHNAGAAARCLCLSFLAHEAPAFDLELLRRSYRLAARIFRDLHLTPLAIAAWRIAPDRGVEVADRTAWCARWIGGNATCVAPSGRCPP